MYNINDKSAAIRDIQKYLSEIYKDTLVVNENGIFDENTTLALNRFQKENGFEIKNYVDFTTFSAIADAYYKAIFASEARKASPQLEFPLSRGMQGSEIYRLNSMLRDILEYYSFFEPPALTNYYSEQTESAVKRLCHIFDMNEKSEIDEIIYLRIEKELHSINRIIRDENEYFPK